MAIEQIQVRRGVSADWVAANPVLAEGEPAFETDTNLFRVGNGFTPYVNLPTYLSLDQGQLPSGILSAIYAYIEAQQEVPVHVSVDLSYKKRIVHNLVYQHADAAAALAQFGSGLYPQAFVIDTVANEILTISGPPQIVSVYDWTTGAYKGVVYSLGRSGVSESADIRYIGGRRYLYTVDVSGKAGTVTRFDITTTPTKLSTISPDTTYTADVLNSIHYRNGHWVSASFTPFAGSSTNYRSRGRLSFFDDSFTQTGMADFPVTQTGGATQYQAASMPKMQGFDEGPGYFVFGCGGGTSGATTLTPYHYQGVRMFSPGGGLIVDSLLYADQMLAILNANGCNGNIIENEGVQVVNGKIYTLFPINTGASAGATSGGIVVMEEFCADKDAIDFSAAAASWAMPDTRRIQSGSYPISADGKLRNLVTWEAMNSLTDVCSYMQATGQDRVAFYSTDVNVTDGTGTLIPNGYFVEVVNRNFASYVVTFTGSGTTRKRLLSFDGTNWSQSNYPEFVNFTPASPLQNVSGSTTNRYWLDGGMVFFQFAVAPASGNLPTGNNVILATGGLPVKYRPDFSVNAAVAGNTSGPAMRFSADSTGLVQLVNVPASTYTYASGIVSWPAVGIV